MKEENSYPFVPIFDHKSLTLTPIFTLHMKGNAAVKRME